MYEDVKKKVAEVLPLYNEMLELSDHCKSLAKQIDQDVSMQIVLDYISGLEFTLELIYEIDPALKIEIDRLKDGRYKKLENLFKNQGVSHAP